MIQIYMHIYFFLFRFFSIKDYYKVLNTVPCAMQQGLVGYLFYLFLSFFVYLFIYSYVLSHVPLSGTPWTVAHQAPLPMGFSRQEYWSGLPFSPSGDLPDPGIKPASLASSASTGVFFTTSTTWEFRTVNPKFLNYPFPFPFGNHKLVLYVYESVSVLQVSSQIPHISDIVQYLTLTCFTQHDNLYIHPCCCEWHYFILFMTQEYSIVYLLNPFICQQTLGCFLILAVVNSAAVNIGVYVSFQVRAFSGHVPRSGIAGSYGNSIFSF